MSVRKKVTASFFIAGLSATTLVAIAPSAFAHSCSTSYSRICLFNDNNYTGGDVYNEHNTSSTPTLTWNLATSGFNDAMSSWFNASLTRDAKWFFDQNLGGTGRCMESDGSNDYVGWYDNDEASSVATYNYDSAC